ncbi:MAG: Hpt domain-containing protein [Marinilabiliaceae bacterium]|nr:Hpt domain-containing protein [Marinilabiliaceae bacterium]
MLTDLTYLREATDGNASLIYELISLFETQIEEFDNEMQQALAANDAERLRKAAHKAKGSTRSLGMNKTADILVKIEDLCIGKNSIDTQKMKETLSNNVNTFITQCHLAMKELRN